jgi:hypothetical protein
MRRFLRSGTKMEQGEGKEWKVGYYGVTVGKMQAINNRQYGDCLLECARTEKQVSNSGL